GLDLHRLINSHCLAKVTGSLINGASSLIVVYAGDAADRAALFLVAGVLVSHQGLYVSVACDAFLGCEIGTGIFNVGGEGVSEPVGGAPTQPFGLVGIVAHEPIGGLCEHAGEDVVDTPGTNAPGEASVVD